MSSQIMNLLSVGCATLAASAAVTPTLLVGIRHRPEASKRLDDLFWAVADPSNEAEQLDSPADIAALSLAHPMDLGEAKEWLASIGARMNTLRVLPTGDAVEVEWPQGEGRMRAPKVPGEFADYVVLKGARPENVHKISEMYQMGKKRRNLTKTHEKFDLGYGHSGQKQAYSYPQGLKGTNPNNSQLVFGTGTYG